MTGLAAFSLTSPSGSQAVGPVALGDPALDAGKAQKEIEASRREGESARRRAERLEAKAREVTRQADKTAQETAAVAARIQQTQAAIAGQQAQIRHVAAQRAQLRAQMALRQAPLARLTGSLQRFSRRPPLLALLRPGSVRDAVYLRALLDTLMPEVERRTAALRTNIAQSRALENRARAAQAKLRQARLDLDRRRQQLAGLEARQRLASREVAGIAAREAEHALGLSERARDLEGLLGELDRQAAVRQALADLPGPVLRPSRPEEAQVAVADDVTPPTGALSEYTLPVLGRLLTGFGESAEGQARSRGLALAAAPQAQVIAPASGRVAFAGPYRGYGTIVIVEHEGGWTSLVTGLARLDTAVGQTVVAGSPLGVTGPGESVVRIELRRAGQPVNPLGFVKTQ